MIRHTVVFKLKYPAGSPEETKFLKAASKLSSIPGVHQFECLRQTSKKSDFDFGISMEFSTLKTYEEYNNNPDHISFVKTFWLRDVSNYLEIDFEPLK